MAIFCEKFSENRNERQVWGFRHGVGREGRANQKEIAMSKRKDFSLLLSAAGWIASLVEKIIAVLRERGITDEDIHAMVKEEGKELVDKIADAIAGAVKQIRRTYAILVDFGMSIEELLKLGKYDWSNSDITSEHFPTKHVGKVETKVEFLHFDRNISSDEVLKEMDKMGYRPAEAHELLAFGEKYPDVQREFPIAALGSVWRLLGGRRSVVCLYWVAAKRGTGLSWFGGGWHDCWRFAAVRK